MALEQVFDCPRRIRELRSGPLGGYVDEFCNWLVDSGFRRWTVRKHVSNVSHLGTYFDGQTSSNWETISSQDIDGFFQTYPSICRNRGSLEKHVGSVRWSVNRFIQFLRLKGLFTDSREEPIYQPLLDGYMQWMRDYQDVSDGTLEVRVNSITQYLQSLGQEATEKGLSKLSREKIEQFFLDYAQRNGRSARRSMQSALRTFFRFCLHQGYLQQPLDGAVPTLRTYKLATVPRGLADRQAQQVLCGINRQTDVGKRNYAILRLLATYGVRGGQVRALRLEDIDWAANEILFKAAKRGKDTRLPLTSEVGESLLDYLQNARPACSCPEVFLTCRAPYRPLPYSSSLSAIVSSCLRAAGIDSPVKGAHAFRHGLASRMAQQGHSLKAVADVLGHRHLSTTFIYTKVDFKTLQQVPLEWPEEVTP